MRYASLVGGSSGGAVGAHGGHGATRGAAFAATNVHHCGSGTANAVTQTVRGNLRVVGGRRCTGSAYRGRWSGYEGAIPCIGAGGERRLPRTVCHFSAARGKRAAIDALVNPQRA